MSFTSINNKLGKEKKENIMNYKLKNIIIRKHLSY